MDRYALLVACRSGEVNWIVVALLLRSGNPSLWGVVKVSWLVTALLLRTGLPKPQRERVGRLVVALLLRTD